MSKQKETNRYVSGGFLIPNLFAETFSISDLTQEQRLVNQTINEFMDQEITSEASVRRIETKDFLFSRQLLLKLGRLGFLGIEVPEEYGGTNLGVVISAIVAEAVAKQDSFAVTFLAHMGIGTLPIRFYGTEDQKRLFLPSLVKGEKIASYCLTETSAGSDANNVKTSAVKLESGGYRLNGEKIFVTNGGFADIYIIFAQLEGSGLTAFIVERTTPGVTVGKEEHKMGIQGSSTATILLNDVHVSAGNLLGEPGKGFKIAVNILNLGRFKLGAACLGGGRVSLKESLNYSKQRKQFGQPIFSFGAIRQKIAFMAARVYAMESIVYRTAGAIDEALQAVDFNNSRAVLKAVEEFAPECSIVKVSCSEDLDFIVDENVQIHGGLGFCEGNPERHYRDSRINRIFEGTNEINRMLLVSQIMKKVLTGSLSPISHSKKVLDEAMSPSLSSESEVWDERFCGYLDASRKAFLIIGDSVINKYNPVFNSQALSNHQVVLMALADYLIELYRMDSVLAATLKNKNQPNKKMTELIFHESMFKIERLCRELLAICSEGDDRRIRESIIKRFLKFRAINLEEICDAIANTII